MRTDLAPVSTKPVQTKSGTDRAKRKEKEMFGIKNLSKILGSNLPSKGQAIGRMFHRVSAGKETVATAAR